MTGGIVWTNLAKCFDGTDVLRGVSGSVKPGETLALMGRSGSGKSTLLRCLALLEPTSGGSAWLDGEQYLDDGEVIVDPVTIRRRISLVFQHLNLFPTMSVLQNCILGPVRALGIEKSKARAQAGDMLEALSLAPLMDRYPATLSGGEAQRVAIARALLMRPAVLLLDEVTSALDPESVYSVLETIQSAREIAGNRLSIILVTHLLRFAESFATHIGFLDQGVIVDLLPAESFSAEARSVPTRKFVAREQAGWKSAVHTSGR
ncbi:ATP-binding cassette domain-containing protein [Niveispirillum sp. SYP-B3756]|uniref:amino acid ABC transporter ATP-binding protein n=1 Tax=Niveispirillum sp. SYP-B3756 TaxID=2662178 RepID=UPI0012928297|nr:ATP-binding cassette domain-containing protein [Niveispirillum sp. SYP-B3756]MQP68540.1 ATP-binding cassette domain-containing protein [Niveispirillum sp. SYP-B3756]